MNGGRNAIKGYLYQYLICVLDSFQDDWDSVIVEPHTDKEKIDILWLYEIGREKYKKAVQVKSTQNIFDGEEILRIAEELKNNFKDANRYELILIGSITRKLRKYLKQNRNRHAGVKITRAEIFGLEAFICCACDKLDTYLNDNFDTQPPRRHRENIVLNLIGKLLCYSTDRREATRSQFESDLQYWIQSYVSPSDYELIDNAEFSRDYGFNAPPKKRVAVKKNYRQKARNIKISLFKEYQNFLDIDPVTNELKVVYPRGGDDSILYRKHI